MLQLSNPRIDAIVNDWPSGSRRVRVTFAVEGKKSRGERVARVTTGKPKRTTYYLKIRIVDGDDGRIYLLGLTEYNQIVVVPGTLTALQYFHDASPEFESYRKLLMDAS